MTRKSTIQAVRPTLFNVTLDPDLLIVVLMANFMSETFDGFATRAHKAVRHPPIDQAMSRLQQFVNARFFHLLPMDVAHLSGLQERELLTDPLDVEANDYATRILQKGLVDMERTGALTSTTPHTYLSMGAFPKYVYPISDLVAAYAPRVTPDHPAALGVTCCADECLLIAGLAIKLGLCTLDDIVIMGSPMHYTLFLFPENHAFWFNAKRDLVTAESWKTRGGDAPAVRRDTFLAMSYGYDRIITPRGSYIFPLDRSTLPQKNIITITEKITRFLQCDLPDLQAAAARPSVPTLRPAAPAVEEALLAGLPAAQIAETAKTTAPENSLAALARYASRTLDVPDPTVYVDAARDSFRAYIQAARVQSPDDALALVRAIEGQRSVLNADTRIAHPDEVLYFNTASPVERALLLHTLLSHAPELDQKPTIALHPVGATVTFGNHSWDAADLCAPAGDS